MKGPEEKPQYLKNHVEISFRRLADGTSEVSFVGTFTLEERLDAERIMGNFDNKKPWNTLQVMMNDMFGFTYAANASDPIREELGGQVIAPLSKILIAAYNRR